MKIANLTLTKREGDHEIDRDFHEFHDIATEFCFNLYRRPLNLKMFLAPITFYSLNSGSLQVFLFDYHIGLSLLSFTR